MTSKRSLVTVGVWAMTGVLVGCGSSAATRSAVSSAPVPTAQATLGQPTEAATQVSSTTSAVPSPPPGAGSIAATTGSPATSAASPGAVDPNAPEVHEVGDIPDNQVFVPFQSPTELFSLSYPEGWSQTGTGNTVSFTDKLNAIEVSVGTAALAPTIGSVTSTEIAHIAATAAHFQAGSVSIVNRKAGEAILATYQIDSAPNAVTGKSIRVAVERYEFWKNGTSVAVTLIGAVGADNVDPWKIVSNSFAWTK